MTRASLLVLSFSPIVADARVLKQVELFKDRYDVTTCGFGPAPAGVVDHVEVPAGLSATDVDGRLITARWYSRAYWSTSAVAWARRSLRGRRFDVVLANDVEAVPVAVGLAPTYGVHADLHEYAPAQHDENAAWKRRIAPYKAWICRRYVTRAASVTTVADGIAAEYRRVFGVEAGVVTNAAPFHDLQPGAVPAPEEGPLRLVHSGVAQRKRRLDLLVDAVHATPADVTLDLFLMPNDPAHLLELRERAAADPRGRVRFHEPVAYAQLVETLNRYDVGLAVFPFVNFNIRWSLPNKLFDYVQARLGVVVGPSPEMAGRVEQWGVGVVSPDFSVESLTEVLTSLDRETVRGLKESAHARARELSAEIEVAGWEHAVEALVEGGAA